MPIKNYKPEQIVTILSAPEPKINRSHLNYAQIHFASVAAFVAGWRSS